MSTCLPLPAFADDHEILGGLCPPPLEGARCVQVSVRPTLTVVLVDSFTLALGGYVPVLTLPQRAEWRL